MPLVDSVRSRSACRGQAQSASSVHKVTGSSAAAGVIRLTIRALDSSRDTVSTRQTRRESALKTRCLGTNAALPAGVGPEGKASRAASQARLIQRRVPNAKHAKSQLGGAGGAAFRTTFSSPQCGAGRGGRLPSGRGAAGSAGTEARARRTPLCSLGEVPAVAAVPEGLARPWPAKGGQGTGTAGSTVGGAMQRHGTQRGAWGRAGQDARTGWQGQLLRARQASQGWGRASCCRRRSAFPLSPCYAATCTRTHPAEHTRHLR